jgi:hypothetical protein
MAAAAFDGSATLVAETSAPDGLLLAFTRLCRQLERPVTEVELRASVTVPEGGVDLSCLRYSRTDWDSGSMRGGRVRAPWRGCRPLSSSSAASRGRLGWCAIGHRIR